MNQIDTTHLKNIRAVIFDMDGTLVLTNGLHFDAYQKIFDRYNIKADYDDFLQNLVGIGAYNVLKTIFERNNIHVDFAELAALKRDLFNEMIKDNEPRPVNGLYEFLDLLDEKKLLRAVASAANKQSIHEVLKSINITNRLPVVVSCEEVPLPKPAPDVFIEAARQLGQLQSVELQNPHPCQLRPEECVVIEDTAHGIQAARAAGMTAIALLTSQSGERLRQAGAHHLCKDFFEVAQLFN